MCLQSEIGLCHRSCGITGTNNLAYRYGDCYFHSGVFDPFMRDQYFRARESELSAFCSDNGWDRLAIRYAVEGIKRTTFPYPGIFYSLSIFFQKLGDRDRAELCLRRASE